ncbi:hypothetical protein IZ6_17780 [Terrihabitans soli]|uniref:Uncharacterized protein n=1 Tax=Terrihabitans soli TaxID=708113 RepID=A0A6S6QIH1_9HYPH|nr:hypothetical protein [Terrihabitans soli]BCJ91043.1 hypothetical protein IZ6_17780 [Terrihabitans soli]
MKTTIILTAAMSAVAFAAAAQTPPKPAKVDIKLVADMPSLTNATKKDLFTAELSDSAIAGKFELSCQAGRTSYGVINVERGCQVGGNGSVLAPDGRKLPRTQYKGGFSVATGDGSTDVTKMEISYLALGKAPAASERFKGSLNLKPQLNSGGVTALRTEVLKKLGAGGSVIDERTDTIKLNRFYVPSAGLPSDKGCYWNGTLLWAYQTETWYIDVAAMCDEQGVGAKEYKFKGNMPWTDSPGEEGKQQLDLTLTMPGKDSFGDEALFASQTGDTDLFASVDGISGQILLVPGADVKVKVDGVEDEVPGSYEGTGSFTGTSVPLNVVRSFATVLTINLSSLLGG